MCVVCGKSKSYQLILIVVNAIAINGCLLCEVKAITFNLCLVRSRQLLSTDVWCGQGNCYQVKFGVVKAIAINWCLLWSRQQLLTYGWFGFKRQ